MCLTMYYVLCVVFVYYIYTIFCEVCIVFVSGLHVYTHTHIVCVCRLMRRCVCIKVEKVARVYAHCVHTHTHRLHMQV